MLHSFNCVFMYDFPVAMPISTTGIRSCGLLFKGKPAIFLLTFRMRARHRVMQRGAKRNVSTILNAADGLRAAFVEEKPGEENSRTYKSEYWKTTGGPEQW